MAESESEELASEEAVRAVPADLEAPKTEQHQASWPDRLGSHWHATRLAKWARRRTIRQIRLDLAREAARVRPSEARQNAETRLPDSESVGCAGLVLIEVFPPSMVSSLSRLLAKWPTDRSDVRESAQRMLASSRRNTAGGLVELGTVRHPDQVILGDGWHDPDLPAAVDAVLVTLLCKTQSLAGIAATFILDEEAGDLSSLLRTHCRPDVETTLKVRGFAGRLREKVPWSRPRNVKRTYTVGTVDAAKANTCERRMRSIETDCHIWLTRHFPGQFAELDISRRPIARAILCNEMIPFTRPNGTHQPVMLGSTREVWRPDGAAGWALSPTWTADEHRSVMTFAARRCDVEESDVQPGTERSNWAILHSFHESHVGLIARYSLIPLLLLYIERLGELRDAAGVRRRIHRPVNEAARLDRFLLHDGLDVTAITRDIRTLTRDPLEFGWDLAKYTLDPDNRPPSSDPTRGPTQLVPYLSGLLDSLATTVPEDAEALTAVGRLWV